ncbi:MAG: hypothetical protein WC757_01605 [Candidatus Paceibacterota bacterium]|jgi:hypothetical protein
MAAPEPRDRISKTTMYVMVSIGFVYDLLGLIPFVNIATAIVAPFHFWAWFKIKGAKYIEPNAIDITKKVSMWILEAIPVVGEILPGLTLQVYFAARKVRKDDKAYNEEQENMYAVQMKKQGMEYRQRLIAHRQQEQEFQDRIEQEQLEEQQRQHELTEKFQNWGEQRTIQDSEDTGESTPVRNKNLGTSIGDTDNRSIETATSPRTAYDRDKKAA